MAEFIHIDKLLTNFATRYTNENFVADFISPPFKVKNQSDKYAEYTASTLRVYDNKVKGREKAKEISWDVESSTYTCEDYSLSFFIEDNELNNTDLPINLRKDATKQVHDAQTIAREKRILDVAGSTGVVTQTAAPGDWNQTAGTPVTDILLGIKVINKATLKKANAFVTTLEVALSMITTDEWKEYFKYTTTGFAQLFDAIAGLRNLGLESRIAGAAGLSTYEGTASDPALEIMWGEKALLFWREPNPTIKSRAFMFSPFTKMNEITREREARSRGEWVVIFEQIDELLVDASSAYLFTDCLA